MVSMSSITNLVIKILPHSIPESQNCYNTYRKELPISFDKSSHADDKAGV